MTRDVASSPYRLAAVAAFCCLTLGVARGVGFGQDSPQNPLVVRGDARLAWFQSAQSTERLGQYRFLLYVDDVPLPLLDVQCGSERTSQGYSCSSSLPPLQPGDHRIEISTYLSSWDSGRSNGLFVRLVSDRRSIAPAAADGAPPARVCTAGGEACYSVSRSAAFNAPVGGPVVAPDGRIFLVEDRRRIRVLGPEGLTADAALESSDAVDIAALAFAADFDRSRIVFVATVRSNAVTRARTMDVVRYRDVAGHFGEGATILADVPLEDGGDPRVGVDTRGLIYVAMPGNAARARDVFAGAVLRVTSDGLVPADGIQRSPVWLAGGSASPAAMLQRAADGERLWMAGAAAGGSLRFDAVRLDDRSGITSWSAGGRVDAASAALGDGEPGTAPRVAWVTRSGEFVLGRLEDGGVLRASPPVPLPGYIPLAVAVAPSGDVWLVARDVSGLRYYVLRLAALGSSTVPSVQ